MKNMRKLVMKWLTVGEETDINPEDIIYAGEGDNKRLRIYYLEEIKP